MRWIAATLAALSALAFIPAAAMADGAPTRREAQREVVRLARAECRAESGCVGFVVSRPTRCYRSPGGWTCRMVFRMVEGPGAAAAACRGSLTIVRRRAALAVGAAVLPICETPQQRA